MKQRAKLYGPILLLALVCAAVFWTGAFKKPRVFENVTAKYMTFDRERLHYSTEEGDAHGALTSSGPGWSLSAGTYRLRWSIGGDGEAVLRLTDGNGAAIEPNTFTLSARQGEGELFFELADACENLTLEWTFASGETLDIYDVKIDTPAYQDDAFTLLFFAAGFGVLWLLANKGKTDDVGPLLFIALAALIASSVSLKSTFTIGHDGVYHLARIQNLADGLKYGQFPVRMGGFSYNGYGALTSVFYPDVWLYPFALMLLGGASVAYTGNVLCAAVNIASAVSMYAAGKGLLKNRWAATCAAILYELAIYRVTDVYTRMALGEMLAMVFLPLFLWGLWEVVCGDKAKWKLLALSACAIYLSHMLSTLMCAVLAAGFALLHIRGIIKEKRMLPLMKAVGLCLLLCAFQLAPFVTYSMQGVGASGLVNDLTENSIEPGQILTLGQGSADIVQSNRKILGFSMEIGLPLMVGAALALYAALNQKERGQTERLALELVAAGALLAVMATDFFPWGAVMTVTRGKAGYIQFTWRLLMLVTPLLALAGGYGFAAFGGKRQDAAAVAALCLAALCAMPTLRTEMLSNKTIEQGANISPHLGLAYAEYTLPDTHFRDTWDRTVHIDGNVTVSDYAKTGTTVTAHVHADTDGTVALPLFGFDGYRATADGQELALSCGESNRLTAAIPAGTDGELRVWFAGRTWWRATDAVSLAALVGVILTETKKRRMRHGRCAQKEH